MSEKVPRYKKRSPEVQETSDGYYWCRSEDVAELETKLAAHLENEGDECPLCQLEAKNEKLQEAIRQQQETADARQCPCRLHFKHAVPEVLDA